MKWTARMRTLVFSAKSFEKPFLEGAAKTHGHELMFIEAALGARTAQLADGFAAVCGFVNDRFDRATLEVLARGGTQLVALRCAGFNQVDVHAATDLGITVARVPAYSPYAVAEHTVGLMLALNRNLHRAYARVREGNFLLDGLLGFDMHGKTVGIIGTGKIGAVVAQILNGFGCHLLGFDRIPNEECRRLGLSYVPIEDLFRSADIITLHCPLTPGTHHLIDQAALRRMKDGVMLINTSRGAVVDTQALIAGLKSGRVGAVGLDVYEEEADLFFRDLSDQVIQDDVFARLLTFRNVLVTAHQAFFTREALENIADTTMANLSGFAAGSVPRENLVTPSLLKN